MNIKTETINGVTRYIINGTTYERIEDVPEEFRSYLQDKDGNGIPDSFDNIFSSGFSRDGKSAVGSVFNILKNMASSSGKEASIPSTKTYDRMGGESSVLPTLIKITAGIAIGIVIAWYAFKNFNNGNSPASPDSEITESTDGNENEGDASPIADQDPNALSFAINDPIDSPTGMYIAVVQNKLDVLRFNMPDGELIESTDSTISVRMEVEENTNQTSQIFRASLYKKPCTVSLTINSDSEVKNVNIGGTDYKYALFSDSGAGHTYTTHNYCLETSGYSLVMSYEFGSGNPAAFDPPVKTFNESVKVAQLESLIKDILWR